MRFESDNVELKSNEPKDVAKAVFDFFVSQYELSIRHEIAARCDWNAAVAANEAAKREYEKENELGWGPELPYPPHTLKMKEEDAKKAAKNREEAKLFLDFVRDRLLDKFI